MSGFGGTHKRLAVVLLAATSMVAVAHGLRAANSDIIPYPFVVDDKAKPTTVDASKVNAKAAEAKAAEPKPAEPKPTEPAKAAIELPPQLPATTADKSTASSMAVPSTPVASKSIPVPEPVALPAAPAPMQAPMRTPEPAPSAAPAVAAAPIAAPAPVPEAPATPPAVASAPIGNEGVITPELLKQKTGSSPMPAKAITSKDGSAPPVVITNDPTFKPAPVTPVAEAPKPLEKPAAPVAVAPAPEAPAPANKPAIAELPPLLPAPDASKSAKAEPAKGEIAPVVTPEAVKGPAQAEAAAKTDAKATVKTEAKGEPAPIATPPATTTAIMPPLPPLPGEKPAEPMHVIKADTARTPVIIDKPVADKPIAKEAAKAPLSPAVLPAPAASAPVAPTPDALPSVPPMVEERSLPAEKPKTPARKTIAKAKPAPQTASRAPKALQPLDNLAIREHAIPGVDDVAQAPLPGGLSNQTRSVFDSIDAGMATAAPEKRSGGKVNIQRDNYVSSFGEYSPNNPVGMKVESKRVPMDAGKLAEQAYLALSAGQYETAIALYKQGLRSNSKDKNALFGLATAYQKSGQEAQARTVYGRLLSLYPDDQNAINNFLALASQESAEGTLNELFRLERSNPTLAAVPANIGMIYHQVGQGEEASRYLKRAVSLAPDNLTYRYNLAVVLDTQGDANGAGQLYRQLLEEARKGNPIPGNAQRIQERLIYLGSK